MLCHVESQGLCKQQQRLRCQSQCHRLFWNDTSSTPVGFHCYGLPWRDALKQPRQTSFRTASMEQHHENCEHSLLQIKTDRLKVGSALSSKPRLFNNRFFSWPQCGSVLTSGMPEDSSQIQHWNDCDLPPLVATDVSLHHWLRAITHFEGFPPNQSTAMLYLMRKTW